MHHEQFDVLIDTNSHTEDNSGEPPRLRLRFDGDTSSFVEWMETHIRSDLTPQEVDITYRVPVSEADTDTGIISFSDRLTGNHIVECPLAHAQFHSLLTHITAQHEADHNQNHLEYRVTVESTTETIVEARKQMLLVYDSDRTLDRHHSVIPASVEI